MSNLHSNVKLNEEKEKLMIQLRPYEDIILRMEEILYGKQPVLLILFVAIFDSVLIFGHFSQMGIISLFTCYCIIIYVIYFLQHRFMIMRLVPNINIPQSQNAKNVRLHSFEEICQYLAALKQKCGMIADYLLGNQFENIYKIIYVLAVWFTLAFVFNIIGNFWLFFIIINLSLLTPGFNIIVLIFGCVGQLSHALFSVFVNPQNGQGPPPPVLEEAAPHQQPQEQPQQPPQEQQQPPQEKSPEQQEPPAENQQPPVEQQQPAEEDHPQEVVAESEQDNQADQN